ncbi:hypothetical protein N9S44_02005 [Gammaproteobacteria bacterium]|jgi:hypothetical protein|nr:hypothetical protein [Gammaproteobacteria bacterium]
MKEYFKRPNKSSGKPYELGFEDEDGRYFIRYLNKQGNDGYYFEEWAKDKDAYLKKIGKS